MGVVTLSMALLSAASLPAPAPLPPPATAPLAISFLSVEAGDGGPIVAHVALLNPAADAPRSAADTLPASVHAGGRDIPVQMV